MKSHFTTLLAVGAGLILGCVGAVSLGIRDATCTRLCRFDPTYVALQRNTTTSYKLLGNALMAFDAERAREAFQQSMVIDQAIMVGEPNDAAAESGVAYLYGRLGVLSMSLGDYAAGAQSFQTGIKALEVLKQDTKATDKLPLWISSDEALLTHDEKAAGADLYQYWHDAQVKNLAVCREAETAIDDLDFALSQPPERVPELLLIRGRTLGQQGRCADAVATAERLALLTPTDGKQLFDAAKIYALAAANMKPDGAGRLSPADRANRDNYCCKAVGLLTQAAEQHYFEEPASGTSLMDDRDLTLLRHRDDFKMLATTIAGGR